MIKTLILAILISALPVIAKDNDEAERYFLIIGYYHGCADAEIRHGADPKIAVGLCYKLAEEATTEKLNKGEGE